MNPFSKFDYYVTILRKIIKENKNNDFEDFHDVVISRAIFSKFRYYRAKV